MVVLVDFWNFPSRKPTLKTNYEIMYSAQSWALILSKKKLFLEIRS
jgi:hypothetical protein